MAKKLIDLQDDKQYRALVAKFQADLARAVAKLEAAKKDLKAVRASIRDRPAGSNADVEKWSRRCDEARSMLDGFDKNELKELDAITKDLQRAVTMLSVADKRSRTRPVNTDDSQWRPGP